MHRRLLPIAVLILSALSLSVPALAQWQYIKTYPDLTLSQVEFTREGGYAIKGVVWNVGTGPAEGVTVAVTDESKRELAAATLGFIPVSGSAKFTLPIQGLLGTHKLTVTAATESGIDAKPADNSQTIICPLPGLPLLAILLIVIVVVVVAGVGYYLYLTLSKPKRPGSRPLRLAP